MTEDKTIPVSARLTQEQVLAIKLTGETSSDFVRKAVDERLISQDSDFIKKKIKELKENIKILEKRQKEIESKEKEKNILTEKEIRFFIESDEILKRKPEVLDGRINLYTNLFMKTYTLSRKEFLEKIKESYDIVNKVNK